MVAPCYGKLFDFEEPECKQCMILAPQDAAACHELTLQRKALEQGSPKKKVAKPVVVVPKVEPSPEELAQLEKRAILARRVSRMEDYAMRWSEERVQRRMEKRARARKKAQERIKKKGGYFAPNGERLYSSQRAVQKPQRKTRKWAPRPTKQIDKQARNPYQKRSSALHWALEYLYEGGTWEYILARLSLKKEERVITTPNLVYALNDVIRCGRLKQFRFGVTRTQTGFLKAVYRPPWKGKRRDADED